MESIKHKASKLKKNLLSIRSANMDDEANVTKVCEICKLKDTDKLNYGEWLTSDDCTIHYFCALLSYSCLQNGDDNEGFNGFLVPDIRYTSKAHAKMKCSYCRKKNATVRCAEPKCCSRFHVVCGVKNKCLNQFDDAFLSYCHRHVNIVEKDEQHRDFWHCQICREEMGDYDPITSIPSCCDQGYYHKKCMQEYAISAGYLAHCPSCGEDPDGYRKFLRSRGIFCPDKDADWELTKQAYVSLLYVHQSCDAVDCLCPKGRKYVKGKGQWRYSRCRFCGSVGTHAACRTDDQKSSFGCESCLEKEEIWIQTQSQPTNNNIKDANDSETKPNDSSTSRPRKRKHSFSEDDEGKVWKMVPTKRLSFRKSVVQLTDPDEESSTDPLCNTEKQKEREDRLKMFFDSAQFDAKPPTPPWII